MKPIGFTLEKKLPCSLELLEFTEFSPERFRPRIVTKGAVHALVMASTVVRAAARLEKRRVKWGVAGRTTKTKWGPQTIAQLVNITLLFTMVYDSYKYLWYSTL